MIHRISHIAYRISFKRLFLLSCVVCLASCVFLGCGYTSRSMVRKDFRTIYVKPFENKIDITTETNIASKYKVNRPLLATDVGRQVTDRFLFDGNLRPVREEEADLLLEGQLTEFRRDALRYTTSDDVEEYRLNLVVNIALRDRRKHAELWKERKFTGDTTYFTQGPAAKSEELAINDAIQDLARRIVERTVEEW